MLKIIIKLIFLGVFIIGTPQFVFSQTKYMTVTTIESVIEGGLGRSKMITVNTDGKSEEVDLKNLYSLVGINFGNITENLATITHKINQLSGQGWEMVNVARSSEVNVSGGPQSISSKGIFMTTYYFTKK